MRLCARCGRENTRGELVCRTCGTVMRLVDKTAEVAATPEAETGLDLTVDRSMVRHLAAQIDEAGQNNLTSETPIDEMVRSETKWESPTLGPIPADLSTSATMLTSGTQTVCRACGAEQRAGSRFCSECAAPLSDFVTSAPTSSSAVNSDSTPNTELYEHLETPKHIENGAVAPGAWVAGLPALVRSVDRSWAARWRRGIDLTKISVALLRQQPGLLSAPVISAAFVGCLYLSDFGLGRIMPTVLGFVFWIGALVAMATVSVTSQAVIIYRVHAIAEGSPIRQSEALRAVRPRIATFAAWGTLSLSVGLFIRTLESGRGPLGFVMRLVAIAINVASSAATFFVLPVILFENLEIRPAIARSRDLLRTTWGEGLIGVGVISLAPIIHATS